MINPKSVEMDRSVNHSHQDKSLTRAELIYSYAEKYNQHKNELKAAYKDKDIQGLKFEPDLNPRSLKLVEGSHKSFSDRTMDHYMNKHKRRDKDPNQIEFEK